MSEHDVKPTKTTPPWRDLSLSWGELAPPLDDKRNTKYRFKRGLAMLGLAILAAGIAAAIVFGGGLPALAALGAAAQWATVGAFFVGAPSLLAFLCITLGQAPAKDAGARAWGWHYAKLLVFGTLALPMTVLITIGIAKAAGASIAGTAAYSALAKVVSGSVIAKTFAALGVLAGIQAAGISIAFGFRWLAAHVKDNSPVAAKALSIAAEGLLITLPWSLGLMLCSIAISTTQIFVEGAKATWQTAAVFAGTVTGIPTIGGAAFGCATEYDQQNAPTYNTEDGMVTKQGKGAMYKQYKPKTGDSPSPTPQENTTIKNI